MINFKKLKIWNLGIDVVFKIYKITKNFPKEELYGLTKQINRASVSIPSNIAEGSSRKSEKDYHRFLEIALGSSFELETQIIISKKLKLINANIFNEILNDIDNLQKMIQSLMNKLS